MLRVVLLLSDNFERSTAELIENLPSITNLDTLIEAINKVEGNDILKKENCDDLIRVYPINDFTTDCNDQIIDLDTCWVTYVNFND